MIIFLKIVLLALLFNSQDAYAQTKSESKDIMATDKIGNEKLQVLGITRQLTQLMIDKNTEALNKILVADFMLTHITGYVQSKEEWFSEIESERMKYYSYTELKTAVKIEGNKATFVGQNLLDARIWGTRKSWRLQQTMHLEKRHGKWIILTSVAALF